MIRLSIVRDTNKLLRKIDLTNFRLATSGTARQINRRIALSFIRRQAPLSRADLARCSGLQPSTGLGDHRRAHRGRLGHRRIGHAPRGRRPRLLHLNVERAGILAVDLRPETTTVGLAGVDARFVKQASWRTPEDPRAFVQALARTVRALRRGAPADPLRGHGREPAGPCRPRRPPALRAEPPVGPGADRGP